MFSTLIFTHSDLACCVCMTRYLTPNFYYDMVDYCRGRVAAGAAWSWSSLLPNPVIGYSPSSFMNLLNAVAGYAVICRELGLPFRWSGGWGWGWGWGWSVRGQHRAPVVEYC